MRRSRSSPVVVRRARIPDSVRQFRASSADEARFANLTPIAAGSAWSAVVLLSPQDADQSATLISQRDAGARAFGITLSHGKICVEGGVESRASRLSPPPKQWSYVAVACDAGGVRIYLGRQDSIAVDDQPGLVAGKCSPESGVSIGNPSANFSGCVALTCLYSARLADDTMREICAGRVDPLLAPKLCFGWLAAAPAQLDIVSRREPAIVGTRVIPFGMAGTAAPFSAEPANVVVPRPQPADAKPVTPSWTREQPVQRPIAAKLIGGPVDEPRAAQPVAPEVLNAAAPEVTDPAAAAHSALFRELGLVDDPEDKPR